MEISNPYQRPKTNRKVDEYKQKLSQRNENQNWILSNYFGKPGGGAPLRDNKGNLVTKIKTIADDNIYHLESKEFTKSAIVQEETKGNFNKTFPSINLPQLPNQIPLNQTMPLQQPNYPLNNSMQIPNQMNQQMYLQQFRQNYTLPPPGFPMMPYFPYPPYFYYPPPPYPYPYPKIENSKQPIKEATAAPIPQQIPKEKEKEDDGYCLPVPKEGKEMIKDKETQKQLWQKELLAQIDEKKKRDEREKQRMEELDKLEEIKYQEYLQIKKEQAEQQELKRKNKAKGKKNMLSESNDKTQNQNVNLSSGNLQQEVTAQNQNNQSMNNNIIESNGNLNENSNQYTNQNELNQSQIPQTLLEKQEQFKKTIENKYKSLADLLNTDFDKELQKITQEYNSKYSDFTKELLNYPSKEPLSYKEAKLHSEKRLNHVQDMIEQRNLIDYIFDKPQINLNGPAYNNPEIDVKVPSYFGINVDPNENKYTQLQSSSMFLGGKGDRELPTKSTVLVESKMPEHRTFGINEGTNNSINFSDKFNTNNYI